MIASKFVLLWYEFRKCGWALTGIIVFIGLHKGGTTVIRRFKAKLSLGKYFFRATSRFVN
ncbi:hypothetical protein B6N13_02870 [Marinomonas sp. UCMA 3892]|nr:hypothetical protein [Marinomonas sp. UCMA 3892]